MNCIDDMTRAAIKENGVKKMLVKFIHESLITCSTGCLDRCEVHIATAGKEEGILHGFVSVEL